jgi:hypothetical protein
MNFADLLSKMKELDENIEPTDKQTPMETDVEECGSMPMSSPMGAPKQQDNVTMNVSMNGSGAGGIRDLMGILKSIEQGGNSKDADMVIGMEEYANELNAQTAGMDAVIPTGDDIHSKGIEAPKVNGGGNPMQETLMSQLANLYQEIKERQVDETMYDRPALRKASDEADFQKRMQQTTNANAADKARRAQEYTDNDIRLRLAKIGQLKSFRPGITDQEVSAMELLHKQKYGM